MVKSILNCRPAMESPPPRERKPQKAIESFENACTPCCLATSCYKRSVTLGERALERHRALVRAATFCCLATGCDERSAFLEKNGSEKPSGFIDRQPFLAVLRPVAIKGLPPCRRMGPKSRLDLKKATMSCCLATGHDKKSPTLRKEALESH